MLPYMRPKINSIADGYVEREMSYDDTGGPTYRVHYAVTYGGCPARISGPPENCYPAEGPEWEITLIEAERWNETRKTYDWIDIRKMGFCGHEIDAIEHWAEMLDLSDECSESADDMRELYLEQQAESRRDPLE